MRWVDALKEWNKGSPTWCIVRKGTKAYDEVKAIMAGKKIEAAEAPKKIPMEPQRKMSDSMAPKIKFVEPAQAVVVSPVKKIRRPKLLKPNAPKAAALPVTVEEKVDVGFVLEPARRRDLGLPAGIDPKVIIRKEMEAVYLRRESWSREEVDAWRKAMIYLSDDVSPRVLSLKSWGALGVYSSYESDKDNKGSFERFLRPRKPDIALVDGRIPKDYDYASAEHNAPAQPRAGQVALLAVLYSLRSIDYNISDIESEYDNLKEYALFINSSRLDEVTGMSKLYRYIRDLPDRFFNALHAVWVPSLNITPKEEAVKLNNLLGNERWRGRNLAFELRPDLANEGLIVELKFLKEKIQAEAPKAEAPKKIPMEPQRKMSDSMAPKIKFVEPKVEALPAMVEKQNTSKTELEEELDVGFVYKPTGRRMEQSIFEDIVRMAGEMERADPKFIIRKEMEKVLGQLEKGKYANNWKGAMEGLLKNASFSLKIRGSIDDENIENILDTKAEEISNIRWMESSSEFAARKKAVKRKIPTVSQLEHFALLRMLERYNYMGSEMNSEYYRVSMMSILFSQQTMDEIASHNELYEELNILPPSFYDALSKIYKADLEHTPAEQAEETEVWLNAEENEEYEDYYGTFLAHEGIYTTLKFSQRYKESKERDKLLEEFETIMNQKGARAGKNWRKHTNESLQEGIDKMKTFKDKEVSNDDEGERKKLVKEYKELLKQKGRKLTGYTLLSIKNLKERIEAIKARPDKK